MGHHSRDDLVTRLARPLVAAIFVQGGLEAARRPATKVGVAGPVLERLTDAAPVDVTPETLVRVNGAVQAGAGALFAIGVLPRTMALVLAASLVPTTVGGHRFWEQDDPKARSNQRVHFVKNVGLIGGLLLASRA